MGVATRARAKAIAIPDQPANTSGNNPEEAFVLDQQANTSNNNPEEAFYYKAYNAYVTYAGGRKLHLLKYLPSEEFLNKIISELKFNFTPSLLNTLTALYAPTIEVIKSFTKFS